jgi:hypothetical protein
MKNSYLMTYNPTNKASPYTYILIIPILQISYKKSLNQRHPLLLTGFYNVGVGEKQE